MINRPGVPRHRVPAQLLQDALFEHVAPDRARAPGPSGEGGGQVRLLGPGGPGPVLQEGRTSLGPGEEPGRWLVDGQERVGQHRPDSGQLRGAGAPGPGTPCFVLRLAHSIVAGVELVAGLGAVASRERISLGPGSHLAGMIMNSTRLWFWSVLVF